MFSWAVEVPVERRPPRLALSHHHGSATAPPQAVRRSRFLLMCWWELERRNVRRSSCPWIRPFFYILHWQS